MAVKNIKARLEGSYRLIRIRRIKTVFFIVQLIIATVLASLVSYFIGMKWDPFYFPVGTFSFVFLILVLIMSVESIYFKGLEVKFTRNKSRKFLLARNSIRRSIVIISISGLLILMLLLPYTQETILDTHQIGAHDQHIGMALGGSDNSTSSHFNTQDKFGLARTSSIEVTCSDPCEIDIYWEGSSHIYNPQNIDSHYLWTGLIDHSGTQGDMTLFVTNSQPIDVTFDYEVTSEVSPFITTYLPAMGLAFIIIQFVSISIMYPIRETYASSSIYSKKYVEKTEAGEYTITARELSKTDKEEEALLDKTLDLEIPAAPVEVVKKAAPAPPPEEVEMARAKGKVDDGLIEEADIACPNCGELNSAHSALCFSCGAELLASEKKAIDPEIYMRKGEKFASAGNYDDAISCYDEILLHDKSHEHALIGKGQALQKTGKWGSAVQYANTALKLNPNSVDALLLKARILEERDRLDKSMEIYSQILSIDPDNSIAMSKMEQVSQEAALENVEDVLEQFMCIPGVGLARATTLYDAGFTSIEALEKATEEQLAGIKGISKGLAKKIKKGILNLQ